MIRSVQLLVRSIFKCDNYVKRRKTLSLQNMNPNLKKMDVMDISDPVHQRSLRLKERLKKCPGSLPFKEILDASSGDLQANGYPPFTWLRQMVAVVLLPTLFNEQGIPLDVRCKAKNVLEYIKSAGSYTMSAGVEMFRKKLADYLCERDYGLARDHDDLLLNGGTSEGFRDVVKLLLNSIDSKPPAIMIPSPSYHYGFIEEIGFELIPYRLDEDNDWALTTQNLSSAIADAKKKYAIRAIIVINPHNPTGIVLKINEMKEVIKFACKEKLLIMADESYQRNVYGENEFHSFQKVLTVMGKPYTEMEMISVFGLSKDVIGEPGIKGGVLELHNFDKDVKKVLLKSVSSNLCSNTAGQIMMYALADHPVEGDLSYDLWEYENESRLQSLESKAKMITDELNEIEEFSCPSIQGGYFAYTEVYVPERAIEEAKLKCYKPSTFYALKLLNETGVLVTPGVVFGKENNPHIRISILPPQEKMKIILEKINSFNENFLQKYQD